MLNSISNPLNSLIQWQFNDTCYFSKGWKDERNKDERIQKNDSEGWYLAWPGRLAIGSTASGLSLLKSVGEKHNYLSSIKQTDKSNFKQL